MLIQNNAYSNAQNVYYVECTNGAWHEVIHSDPPNGTGNAETIDWPKDNSCGLMHGET